MTGLSQGRIILAKVADPQGGNTKIRPLVVITATSEIYASDSFVAVAITGTFSEPLAWDKVKLPWHPRGLARTKLRKECVAVCSWTCEIRHSDVDELKGTVPSAELREIIDRINRV